jgi:DNA replication protein DnaC
MSAGTSCTHSPGPGATYALVRDSDTAIEGAEVVADGGRPACRRRSFSRRIRTAHFPAIKTLEDFNYDHLPSLRRDLLAHLATSTFVAKAENVILLGPPGIGKTHLAVGLGVKAAQNVLFDTAGQWINRLAVAHQAGALEAELKKIRRYKLIVVDEVGYIPFDTDAADLFFQLVASRYEQGSIIVTSNLPFGQWGETFSDDVVAAAVIDRLVHHAEVLALSGESYRTRARREPPAEDRDK